MRKHGRVLRARTESEAARPYGHGLPRGKRRAGGPSGRCASLAETVLAGVSVVADGFSLRERAIPEKALQAGIVPAALERVVDALADGAKTLWH